MFSAVISMLVAFASASVPQNVVPADARKIIATANAEWLAAMKSRDAKTIAAPYADDGIFVAPTGLVAKGRAAVEQMMNDRFAQIGKVMSGEIVQDGVMTQGSMVYEWGHATLQIERQGAAPTQSFGRYLTVWQKNATGRWEIIRNLSLPN